MRRTIALLAATALSFSTTAVWGAPPASGSISPRHETGQANVECEDAGPDAAPSNSGREPGRGSPFQEDSVSGAHYAGEQPGINDKNTASASQYDIACFKHHPH